MNLKNLSLLLNIPLSNYRRNGASRIIQKLTRISCGQPSARTMEADDCVGGADVVCRRSYSGSAIVV